MLAPRQLGFFSLVWVSMICVCGISFPPPFCQLERLGRPSQPNDLIQVHVGGLMVQSYHVLTSLTVGLALAALSGGLLRSLTEGLHCVVNAGSREGL